MKYRHYTAKEFAADPQFRSWVMDRDPAATVFWENWMNSNPGRREELDEARALLYVLAERELAVDSEELDNRVQAMLAHAREREKHTGASGRSTWLRHAGIAAAVCLSAGLCWQAYQWIGKQWDGAGESAGMRQHREGNIIRFNRTMKPVTIWLEDSSIVTLEPESELIFPEKFGTKKREVALKGEAFFQISRDRDRPFLVKTKELVTRVLGTSFTVRSFEKDPEASVSVKTGQVAVYAKEGVQRTASPGKMMGVMLRPNQRVMFEKKGARMVKTIVDAPLRVNETAAVSLVFDEAPVKNVFKTLEKIYGIELLFNEVRLSDCQLTANLSGLPMYEQLDLVCRIIHARYEVVDGQVVIHADGCNAY